MSDESKLEMLVDVCKKRVATVGGDGYSEYVLYRHKITGAYELHFYSSYVNSKEIHNEAEVDEVVCTTLFEKIKEYNFEELAKVKGIGMCGGELVCKYVLDGVVTRISSSVSGSQVMGPISSMYELMSAYFEKYQNK